MSDKELRKLSRSDLLEILLEVSKENAMLRQKVEELSLQLEQRQTVLGNTGSMSEAAMQINGVFQVAEDSSEQYRNDVQLRYEQQEKKCELLEQRTKERCEKMLESARKDADAYWEETWKKVQQLYQDSDTRKKRKGKLWSIVL